VVYSSNRGGNLDLWAVSSRTGAFRRLTNDPALDWDPTYGPDGKLLWSTNRSGNFEIWRAEADGSGARQLTRAGFDAENPAPTPDGRWLLYAFAGPRWRGIMRARPDGSQPTLLVPGRVFIPEVSPDGRLVAYIDFEGEGPALRVARVADGRPIGRALPLPVIDSAADPDVGRCRWFPDGRSLAVIARRGDRTFVVERHWLVPSGAGVQPPVVLASEPGFAAESLGISPDGTQLTVAYWDHSSNLMLADNVWRLAR
jgi:Tol biopolymer transport system component